MNTDQKIIGYFHLEKRKMYENDFNNKGLVIYYNRRIIKE